MSEKGSVECILATGSLGMAQWLACLTHFSLLE